MPIEGRLERIGYLSHRIGCQIGSTGDYIEAAPSFSTVSALRLATFSTCWIGGRRRPGANVQSLASQEEGRFPDVRRICGGDLNEPKKWMFAFSQ